MFITYFKLGFQHITDLGGYDHMLFLLALCASFQFKDWKRVLVLITAFTIGHSLTLGLAVSDVVTVNRNWVEFLIPLTIIFTCALNVYRAQHPLAVRKIGVEYTLALFFGLIHGLGFSSYLRALLADDLLVPLFSFNIGIEVGQILVIVAIFAVQTVVLAATTVKSKWWNIGVSTVAGGISLLLAAQRISPIL